MAQIVSTPAMQASTSYFGLVDSLPVSDKAKTVTFEVGEDWRVREGLRLLDEHDELSFRHVVQVGAIAAEVAQVDNVPENEIALLVAGALLHDVGKTAVAPEIVSPPNGADGKVDRNPANGDQRFLALMHHSEMGFRIVLNLFRGQKPLEPLNRNGKLISHTVLTHHCHNESRKHYPDDDTFEILRDEGLLDINDLADPALMRLAKDLALADVYEAITAKRVYSYDEGFENPARVETELYKSHPSMGRQIDALMELHKRRFPPEGWMLPVVILDEA